jgi:hypothetical protein
VKLRIVTEKKGWILYRMAREIARRHEETRINRRWPRADIHYFINYGYYRPVKHGLTAATFTHYDPEKLGDMFIETARAVDHCISISNATTATLVDLGIPAEKITTILIGADSRFTPKVRLGLVGRTYSGGRKGEDLVQQLTEDGEVMEGLEIVSFHPGWGVDRWQGDDLDTFYRSLDYLLVPSRREGGPVPFMEALACGVLSIAPPIGVIPDFPHVEYRTGDFGSLRRVILEKKEELLSVRRDLAEHMRPFNWQRWAEEHLALFQQLLDNETGASA